MSDIDLIKSKIDVVDFIGKHLPLKKAGANYKGLCPFHQEKTPSFMVSPEKQIWHCFGCGRGGDVFKFLMEKEGVEFAEALHMLADQAGVKLSKVPREGAQSKKALYIINELAAKYFEKVLSDTSEGRKTKDYLVGRGLTQNTIQEFRLGCAPSGGKALVEFLKRRDVSEQEIERAGLAVRKGKFLQDKFVGRIMFPLMDSLGRVVAFTGRVMDPKREPKYLNSPETPIFRKSELLYGINLAKSHVQPIERAILVEGQMDVISSHQAGVKNVIGTSGTALTPEQLKVISRYAKEIILAMDADEAGSEATKRAVGLAGEFDLNVKVALLGEHKDPDSLIKESADKWKEVVEKAVPVLDFYFDSALNKYDLKELQQKKQLARELLTVISRLIDPVEKDHYLKKLARLVDVEPQVFYDALGKARPIRHSSMQPQKVGEDISPTWLEERALAMPLVYQELLDSFMEQAKNVKWASGLANSVYEGLLKCYTAESRFDLDALIQNIPDHDKTSLLELMLVIEENYKGMAIDEVRRELEFYLNVLSRRSYSVRRRELVERIAEAEKSQNKEQLSQLLDELKKL